MSGLRQITVAALSVACFGLSYVALTNQTPYCYTLREYNNGRVDYREFATGKQAFEYESSQGFWEKRPEIATEESGCSSDKVYGWEGATAGLLAIAGFAGPIISTRGRGASAMRHPFGQLSTIGLAIGVTMLGQAEGWTWALSDWEGWPALSVIILVAAWVNVFAWLAGRWVVVIACSLLTFAAPWGFIYPGLLAGPVLAIAAVLHWGKDRVHNRSKQDSHP